MDSPEQLLRFRPKLKDVAVRDREKAWSELSLEKKKLIIFLPNSA